MIDGPEPDRRKEDASMPRPRRLAALAAAVGGVLLGAAPAPALTSFDLVRSDFPTTTDEVIGLAAGDFDRDGRPDVVAAGWDDQVVVLRNTGPGFAPLAPVTAGSGLFIFWVSALDYDGDNRLDAVTANLNTDFITVLK